MTEKLYIAYDSKDKGLPVAVGTIKELKTYIGFKSVEALYRLIRDKKTSRSGFQVVKIE